MPEKGDVVQVLSVLDRTCNLRHPETGIVAIDVPRDVVVPFGSAGIVVGNYVMVPKNVFGSGA